MQQRGAYIVPSAGVLVVQMHERGRSQKSAAEILGVLPGFDHGEDALVVKREIHNLSDVAGGIFHVLILVIDNRDLDNVAHPRPEVILQPLCELPVDVDFLSRGCGMNKVPPVQNLFTEASELGRSSSKLHKSLCPVSRDNNQAAHDKSIDSLAVTLLYQECI